MNLCMATLDTSSGAESSMDDGVGGGRTGCGGSTSNSHQTLAKQNAGFVEKNNTVENKKDKTEKEKDAGEEGDPRVWEEFNKSFKQVQSVLDRNRFLIQKVNENHQSKLPDNLIKNVALIQEINGNISKVVSLYADLNSNFSTMTHRRNNDKNDTANGNAKDSSRNTSQLKYRTP